MQANLLSSVARVQRIGSRRATRTTSASVTICLLLGAMSCTLSGCFGLAVVGAAAGGMVVSDRRSLGAQTEDKEVELKAFRVIRSLPDGMTNASVTSYNRRLLLSGQIDKPESKKVVEDAIRANVPNLREIYNELEAGSHLGLVAHTKDAALTARVRAALLRERSLAFNSFKVETEGETVYLMGLVTEEEGEKAALITSRQGGVRRVVTLFEYISTAELSRIQGDPANTQPAIAPPRSDAGVPADMSSQP